MRDQASNHKHSGDRLLWTVLGASIVITALTVVATQLTAPPPLPEGRGPMYPRMRMPPDPNMGQLLRTMGIGSLTWYACVLAAPLFIWMSRRLPMERGRWPRSLAVHLVV